MLFLSIVPFILAAVVRRHHRHQQAWLAWVAVSTVTWAVMTSSAALTASVSLGAVLGGSFWGFLAPELGHFLGRSLRRPRVMGTLLMLVLVAVALTDTTIGRQLRSLVVVLILLGIVLGAFRTMARGIWR